VSMYIATRVSVVPERICCTELSVFRKNRTSITSYRYEATGAFILTLVMVMYLQIRNLLNILVNSSSMVITREVYRSRSVDSWRGGEVGEQSNSKYGVKPVMTLKFDGLVRDGVHQHIYLFY